MSNICTDEEQTTEAIKLHGELISKIFTMKELCPYPCKFTRTYFRDKVKLNSDHQFPEYAERSSSIFLKFNKFIKVSKARYSYGGLELLAEFGGYVGLFLGISVFHLSDAFTKIAQLIFHKIHPFSTK